MNARNLLIGIVIVYILKQIALAYLIPPWEAPDEPGHVGYISYLYNESKLPSSYTNFIATSIYESTFIKKNDASFDLSDRRYTSTINVGSHPPLYYLIELVPYWIAHSVSSSFTLFILRLPNVGIGTLILLLVYYFAKRLLKSETGALVTTFLLSIQPMFSFITAIVNSDALVMLCYIVILFMGWLILYENKYVKNRWIVFMCVAALAPLSKPHLAIILAIVAYVALVKTRSIIKTIGAILLCSIPFITWLLYNVVMYGSKFWGYVVMNQKTEMGNIFMYPIEFIATRQPIGIWMSFWGLFGWLNVAMPKWIYILYGITVVVGLWGWKRQKKNRNTIFFIGAALLLYLASILAYDIQYYLLSQTLAIQGRYLAPILPILIGAIAWGGMQYGGVVKNVILSLIIGVFLVGQIAMFLTLINAYRSYFL